MKKILITGFIIILVMGCDASKGENPDGYDGYRKIAWDYLEADNDSGYIGSWEDGIVTESINPETKLPTFFVSFNHKYDSLNGPYGVHIDPNTKEVVYVPIGL